MAMERPLFPRKRSQLPPSSQRPEMSKVLKCAVPHCTATFLSSTLPVDYIFQSDVGQWTKTKEKSMKEFRKVELLKLFQVVNALLNGGGGMLYLHVAINMLHFLDEQLDDVLTKLIPDGSLFTDNYEREVHDDHCHVRIRVQPRRRPLSTLDFKTKASLHKGLTDITHLQMRQLIRNADEPSQSQQAPPTPPPQLQPQEDKPAPNYKFDAKRSFTGEFTQGEKLNGFHENKNVEAKSVKYNADKTTDGRALACHAWTNLKLPERITSFSKEKAGGSYFLGIGEEKADANLPGKNLQGQRSASPNPASISNDRTGHFLCEGVLLPLCQHDLMKQCLRDKIAGTMFWYRSEAVNNQVEIQCHEVKPSSKSKSGSSAGEQEAGAARNVTSGTKLYVIEVSVKTFHGLCFTDPEGPEAYKFHWPDNPKELKTENEEHQTAAEGRPGIRCEEELKLIRISWDAWLNQQLKALSECQM